MEAFNYLKDILSEHYSLGDLVWAERNEKGFLNLSFDIETRKEGKGSRYIFRSYRPGTHENKIRFEHALMRELLARGFHLSPTIIPTKYGATYAKVRDNLKVGSQESVVAVFSYLPGEDEYAWDNPLCTLEELADAAEVLALYHHTICGWQGLSEWKEPTIVDQIPVLQKQWPEYAKSTGHDVFDFYFLEQLDFLIQTLNKVFKLTSKTNGSSLPHLAIHGDYHPGNLKFRNGKVSGLFDFDWARMDTRCFDVALAVAYFCTRWNDEADGDILVDRLELFLDSYQDASKAMKPLGPLRSLEVEVLPQMVLAGTLYIVDWALGDYFVLKTDPDEYRRYLHHGVQVIKWLERNWNSLTHSTQKFRVYTS